MNIKDKQKPQKINVEVDGNLFDEISKISKDETRSVDGQVEHFIKKGIADYKHATAKIELL